MSLARRVSGKDLQAVRGVLLAVSPALLEAVIRWGLLLVWLWPGCAWLAAVIPDVDLAVYAWVAVAAYLGLDAMRASLRVAAATLTLARRP